MFSLKILLLMATNVLRKCNALLIGKTLLAKIATKEQKPTVFCPFLTAYAG
jgi:hypothetical protein